MEGFNIKSVFVDGGEEFEIARGEYEEANLQKGFEVDLSKSIDNLRRLACNEYRSCHTKTGQNKRHQCRLYPVVDADHSMRLSVKIVERLKRHSRNKNDVPVAEDKCV